MNTASVLSHDKTIISTRLFLLATALIIFLSQTLHAENLRFSVSGKRGEIDLSASQLPLTLTLFLADGDLTIVGRDTSTFKYTCKGADSDDQGFLLVDTETGVAQLRLKGEQTDSDLILEIPIHTSIKARVMDGDVSMENIRGDVELATSDGEVWLENLHGSVSATATDGDIRLKLGSHNECRNIALSSFDGDIDLLLPKDFPIRLNAKAIDGEISCQFPFPATPRNNASKQVLYDDQLVFETDPLGIPTLLTSADGDISIDLF